MIKVYGIPTCGSTKQALSWLHENGITYDFHDYQRQGITKIKLKQWSSHFGWEKLLNKQSTTWRLLTPAQQAAVKNEKTAFDFMIESPTVIKRPILEKGDDLLIGFDENEYAVLLNPKG
jgi:arsenate reductase